MFADAKPYGAQGDSHVLFVHLQCPIEIKKL